MRSLRLLSLTLGTMFACAALHAQSPKPSSSAQPGGTAKNTPGNTTSTANPLGGNAATATPTLATLPDYRLSIGDEILVNVHNEPDMTAEQRIDKTGIIRMPYVDEINLANKTVREAELHIQQLLVERKLLKAPHVNITVRDYSAYEVSFFGTGVASGVYRLPQEYESIEIVELFTRYNGIKPTAKRHDVKVYRKDKSTGTETILSVDVDAMEASKKKAEKSFLIYPGDRIRIEDSLF